jgi:serine/threonine-protein kinase
MKISKLGPYRIDRQIGKGGMGAVYLASTADGSGAESPVAVKALNPQLALADGFRERFEAEIDSLKKLSHEGIVRLYGYGEEQGILFYSMEWIDGTSLEDEIHRGRRFTWQETLEIGVQVCRALKHAHDHGVVHRDIKPANLLLTQERRIKMADFGIARLFGGNQLTTAGGVLGTADYMSPEQADGRPVTEKCDQYSLGGVLYALLAGRPPFRAKTMPEMLQLQRFAEPESVRRYAPDTPEQVDRLLLQLLSKNPEERFPNVLVLGRHMEAMAKALARGEQREAAGEQRAELAPRTPTGTEVFVKDATQALSGGNGIQKPQRSGGSLDLYEAATIAQPEEPRAAGGEKAAPASAVAREASLPTHFTTVDEEEIQRQKLQSESHLVLLTRWAALVLLVGGIGWTIWRVTRPATADQVYSRISETLENEGRDDLRAVESELNSFLARFPEDSRAEEVQSLVDQLEFQRFLRRARGAGRAITPTREGPLATAIRAAIEVGQTSPAVGRQMLADLLVLYDPEQLTAGSAESLRNLSDEQRWLVVAREELVALERRATEAAETLLPLLEQRMKFAEELARREPQQAAEMYRAVIRLYGSQAWASEIVAAARKSLDRLDSPSPSER